MRLDSRSAWLDAELARHALHQRAQLGQLGGQPRLLGLQRRELLGRGRHVVRQRLGATTLHVGSAGSPHSRCAQRASRAPGARGSLSTRGGALRRPARRESLRPPRCRRSGAAARSWRATRPRSAAPRSISTVSSATDGRRQRPARAAGCARSATTRLPLPSTTRLSDSQRIERRAAPRRRWRSITGSRAVFWLQPGDQRVERQRIGVGHGGCFSTSTPSTRASSGGQLSHRAVSAQTPKPSSAAITAPLTKWLSLAHSIISAASRSCGCADALARQHLRSASGRARSASGGG